MKLTHEQKQLQREFDRTPEPPEPAEFRIYRDGEIDRAYEITKLLRSARDRTLSLAGTIAVGAFQATDMFITEMNKEFHS